MISCNNLTKVFEETKALDNVTFDIADGCIYGLVGSNGSGKSTFLRLASGIYMPDSGELTIDGQRVFNNPVIKDKIAFLGDTPYFLNHASIDDMACFYSSVYKSFDYGIYESLISTFPLDKKAKISRMSKGMQRQAALILAISTSPKYLLLDEAFDGLDVVMRKVLKQILIDGAQSRGLTTVIASHNLRELEDLCDHVGLIHSGKVLFNDDIESLRGGLHKVQAAFKRLPEKACFDGLNILKTERTGSVLQMVVRGKEEEIMSRINSLDPIFAECIEPTLEEMFVFELEVEGYDLNNIIKE
ncbi:MAG: ABC transporter ATP-binding protein [Clostridia bacterium]|nr:ABC transporter ATP-binding protein [Clostridia bacterium]